MQMDDIKKYFIYIPVVAAVLSSLYYGITTFNSTIQSIEKAAMFACSAAAIKCSRFGGRKGIANRNEVELLMQATYA